MGSVNSYTREDIQNNRRMSEYNDIVHEVNQTEDRLMYLFWTEDCTDIEHMQMYDRWKPKAEDVQAEIDFIINKKLPDIEQHLTLFEKSFPNLVPATKKRWMKHRQEIEMKGATDVNRQKH